MDWILNAFTVHPWLSAACLWVFAAIVSGQPPPAANASVWYTWLYNVLQTLGANLNKIGQKGPATLK